ncbi:MULTISPECIES: hypothetical protein [Bacillus]|uniref:Reductase or disulfide isomerase n=2 Tax=Bacillus cereus group TaxID=86661 RepID=R8QXL9_BACCE|nr:MULTISPECIES: hypothetical protein [Bacillus cereus group]EOP75816.1 hypothetical protein IIQ_04837 [Bacillus cereus VD118]MBJ8094707.1 hypothetical protein [Bacillus cereus]MCQ6356971.1 hypothetical protein [Bacillus cereus]CAH2463501.1 hypothetical protein ACOSJ1_EBGNOMHC_04318 [Bacillus mycoides KBAB4]SCB66649.1 Uncharacterized protein BWGO95_00592 [Bacillus mycoides]
MKETIACPQCEEIITAQHIIDIPHPFSLRCPHCKVKLKEMRITPCLILVAICIIPLFIIIGESIKELLGKHFSIVDHVPTVLIFFLFCYPLYYFYEKYNAILFIKYGLLKVKS